MSLYSGNLNKFIIYKQPTGVIAIVRPTEEALALYGIKAIADKDVPFGLPYKIIDTKLIPTDRSQRNAWTVDDSELTDGVGNNSNQFEGYFND